MKINIRYLGIIVADFDLADTDREYVVGRADDCDIRLTKDFISRRHGKFYFEDSQWWYQDLRENHPHYHSEPQVMNNSNMIELENDIDILTNDFLNQHETKIYNFKDLQRMSEPKLTAKFWVVASLLVVFALGGGFFVNKNLGPKSSTALLEHVGERFVEFEMVKDEGLENEFIAKELLEEKDFKANVGFCSGFLVKPQVVMTASHCILGADGITPMANFQLKSHDGVKHQVDKVLGLDLSRDIILLEVKTLKGYPHFELKGKHEIGEAVYTVGNVHGEGMAVRDGTISSLTKDPNNPNIEYLRYSAGTSPGNSGGPLVDAYGNVAGLVFARSNAAENYNLSAPYSTLKKFLDKFDDPSKAHKIEVNTEKLIFGAYLSAQYQKFNFFNKSANSNKAFYQQETQDKLNNIVFTIEIPTDYQNFKSTVFNSALQAMDDKMKEVEGSLLEDKKLGFKWINHANEKHPVLVPRRLNDSYLTLDQLTLDYLWESNILILEPGSYYDMKPDDHSYTFSSSDNVFPKNFGRKKRAEFPQYLRTYVDTYSSIFANETSLVMIDYSADEPVELDEKKYTKSFKFEGNFVLSPYLVTYPFIRPKKRKEFKIKNIEFVDAGEVIDAYGRKWRKSKFVLLRDIHLYRYCLDYPQAQMCLNKPYAVQDTALIPQMEKNYIRYHLSEKILDLNFWTVDSLANYLAQPDKVSYEFKDVALTKQQENYEIEYKHFGLKYKLSHQPKQMKIQPALVKFKDSAPKWVTIGHQTYHAAKKGKNAFICRSELDFPKLKTSYLAEYYHSNKKYDDIAKKKLTMEMSKAPKKEQANLKRQIASVDKISLTKNVKVSDFKSKHWDETLKVYQACREVIKNDYSEGFYMGDFIQPPTGMFD